MKALSAIQSISIPARVIRNYFAEKPVIVIFEVTLSCNANCLHCAFGGLKSNEQRMPPEKYGDYISEFRPAIVQLSGGEPLMRDDLSEIIQVVKKNDRLPYLILVTNGFLLNEQKYLELKAAGVDRFSISMDFPDERIDDFRRIRGLYKHLDQTIPKLVSHGYRDIAMNCAITSDNLPYLEKMADKCIEWGVDISYSAYSALRTGDRQQLISRDEDLNTLGQTILNLIRVKREQGNILNSIAMLMSIYRFFEKGGIPGCSAGDRFFFVQPDGSLNPCAMLRDKTYSSYAEMQKVFSENNKCTECYVACRAYTDKPLWAHFKDSVEFIRYSGRERNSG